MTLVKCLLYNTQGSLQMVHNKGPQTIIAELTELFQQVSYSLPTYTSFSKQNTLGFAGGSVIKNLLAMQVM